MYDYISGVNWVLTSPFWHLIVGKVVSWTNLALSFIFIWHSNMPRHKYFFWMNYLFFSFGFSGLTIAMWATSGTPLGPEYPNPSGTENHIKLFFGPIFHKCEEAEDYWGAYQSVFRGCKFRRIFQPQVYIGILQGMWPLLKIVLSSRLPHILPLISSDWMKHGNAIKS